jgi:DNA-binding MarR family transcriptional regulator
MPEQHYRPASYRARDSVGYLLRRVYTTMHERIEMAFAGHGFTLMQWIVLIYVRDGLARTASDLVREFRHDSGAMTRVIDQLERRGLLSRKRSTRDRRVVNLALTPKGRRTIEKLLPVVVGQMNAALEPFSRAEFEQLREMMERLVNHLQQLAPPEPQAPSDPRTPTSAPRPRTMRSGSAGSHASRTRRTRS